MRTLVACSDCHRQVDAGPLRAGDRFHCLCGAGLTVPATRAHDAKVVRCSSCGAPREPGDARCRFCEAEFTLHELDLQTICPSCAARVSDRARFCHHCATRIAPTGRAGAPTELRCPTCGDRALHDRDLGPAHVLECPGCAGLWLDAEAFRRFLDAARADEAGARLPGGGPAVAGAVAAPGGAAGRQAGPMYRKCPICASMMARRNFGRRSGVIVDRCNDHGLWFDAAELERILAWVRAGGEREAAARRKEEQAAAARRSYFDRKLDQQAGRATPGGLTGATGTALATGGPDLLDLLAFAGRIFSTRGD